MGINGSNEFVNLKESEDVVENISTWFYLSEDCLSPGKTREEGENYLVTFGIAG